MNSENNIVEKFRASNSNIADIILHTQSTYFLNCCIANM
jgi:hypothetical protein